MYGRTVLGETFSVFVTDLRARRARPFAVSEHWSSGRWVVLAPDFLLRARKHRSLTFFASHQPDQHFGSALGIGNRLAEVRGIFGVNNLETVDVEAVHQPLWIE